MVNDCVWEKANIIAWEAKRMFSVACAAVFGHEQAGIIVKVVPGHLAILVAGDVTMRGLVETAPAPHHAMTTVDERVTIKTSTIRLAYGWPEDLDTLRQQLVTLLPDRFRHSSRNQSAVAPYNKKKDTGGITLHMLAYAEEYRMSFGHFVFFSRN